MTLVKFLTLTIVFLNCPAIRAATCKPPAWSLTKQVKKSGSRLELICNGQGATNEIAEIDASSACDARASGEYKPSIDVNDLVVTDESSTALLRTVAQRSCVVGLQCESLKMFTCEDNGTSYAWRQCSYDLSKARFGSASECQARTLPDSTPSEDSIKNRKSLDILNKKVQVQNAGRHQRGDKFVVTVSSTPPCESILVKGISGRRILCTQNPMPVPVGADDEALVVRATGYVPKEILVRGKARESKVDVYLDESD